jgi:addiction module HigA family antidote
MDEERPPNPHVGDFIREEFMEPTGLTAYRLAKGLGITQSHLSQILKGEVRITAEMALRLEAFFGCSARMWLSMQNAHDLTEARRKIGEEVAKIERWEGSGHEEPEVAVA